MGGLCFAAAARDKRIFASSISASCVCGEDTAVQRTCRHTHKAKQRLFSFSGRRARSGPGKVGESEKTVMGNLQEIEISLPLKGERIVCYDVSASV